MSVPALPPAPAICGAPTSPGTLARLPEIDVAALPPDDRGRPELILRVAHQKDRFCYRYRLGGVEERDAPVLRVHRGERFDLRLVNELRGPASGATMQASAIPPCRPAAMKMAAGSRAFSGYLNHPFHASIAMMPPLDVNLHLHGFQGPALQENVFLSTLSTPAHACEYDITIPRTQPAGTYFYHPHAHGISDDEVAGGLAGMWIVEPDKPQIAREDEHEIVLRYRVPFVSENRYMPALDALNKAAVKHEAARNDARPFPYNPFDPPPWASSVPMRAGAEYIARDRCGTFDTPLLSVNGVDAPAQLTVPANRPQLVRILNATSDTPKYLRLRDAAGKSRPLQIVGRDGVPVSGDEAHPLARYLSMDGVELVPTGRIDVLVSLKPGEAVTLYNDHNCIGYIGEFELRHDLLAITADAGAGASAGSPAQIGSAPLERAQSPAVQLLRYARAHPSAIRRRALTYTAYDLPNAGKPGGHPEFYITETSNTHFREHPYSPVYAKGASAPQPDIVVRHGTIEEWYLFNATLEEHTFHIHQMAFVAEDEPPQPVMLDTVLVPVGTLLPNKADPDYPLIKPGLTRVLLDFRHVPRGTFVFHCHMLFHEDHGMMGVIKVI